MDAPQGQLKYHFLLTFSPTSHSKITCVLYKFLTKAFDRSQEQESVAGGSVAISLLERPSLPPLTYRRWIEQARVLFGREISDLILLGREKIVPMILARRKADFEQAVRQRKEEKEKEQQMRILEKEVEDKRQSDRAEKVMSFRKYSVYPCQVQQRPSSFVAGSSVGGRREHGQRVGF